MNAPALPIDDVLPDIVAALAAAPNLVLAAPPGAGKTTRVPLALLEAGWLAGGRLLMLEPRRIAARAAAERLAATLGEDPGRTVGYRIRGESRTGPQTRIEVVTEGILTAMIQSDPELTGIAGILFDEAHERSLHGDLGLALALDIQGALRPDLRLLVMSATLDTAAFSALMGGAGVIESKGRIFPIETRWLDRSWRTQGAGRRGFETALARRITEAAAETEGDLLAFLPGAGEIGRTEAALSGSGLLVQPLHGALSFADQRAALTPDRQGRRRVVLATTIAETSVTVPGVRVVVDGGLARRARVDPATGLSRLVTGPVSRAQAEQRRGRAGRLAPGWCYRLWTKGEEGGLPAHQPPEILEADLAPLALELARWGVEDAAMLPFPDPPPPSAVRAAQDLLIALGALDRNRRITAHGQAMAARPVHPRLAHMLLRAEADGLGPEAALIAALLSERDPLRGDAARRADLADRIRAVLANPPPPGADRPTRDRIRAEAKRLRSRLPDHARTADHAAALTALAYPDRIARRRTGDAPRYLLSGGRGAVIDPKDPLARAPYLVPTDLEDGPEARIRVAVGLSEGDIRAAFPDAITTEQSAAWDPRQNRVTARIRERLGAIALSDRNWKDVPAEALGSALADGIRQKGIAALPWPDKALRLRARLARIETPDAGLPDWSDTGLAATLDGWLTPHLAGMTRIEDVARLDLARLLWDSLDWDQQQRLDRVVPAAFTTPLGRKVPIDYARALPTISVKVQEMFGTTRHPTAGDPPVALTIELLSPAGRPVQTTADLPGFWSTSYADVRKDMRAQYPRHPWPEDPSAAPPTARARPRSR